MKNSEKQYKTGALLSLLLFILLLLPVIWLSFVNRATGDDYGYGAYTRTAWVSSHSIAALMGAAWKTVVQYYNAWQGTWFSVFVFSLQPEVFHDGAYVIVAFMMLFLWIGSTFYLFRQILGRQVGMGNWSRILVTVLFLIISIEFIPRTKSSIYWFNGCAHYMLPFTMCQMAAAWLLRYPEEYKKSTLLGITVLMTLLGGSNYQAALLILITACYVAAAVWFLRRDKKILTLLLPIGMELAGLIVSAVAPGNRVRGGADFGFSLPKVFETIFNSFLYGLKDIGMYLRERPLVFVGLAALFVLLIVMFCGEENGISFQHPVWLCVMLFCLYSAMQAPEIYAGVDVSGGVENTNFLVFLLTASGILLVVAEKTAGIIKIKWQDAPGEKAFRLLALPMAALCLVLVFFLRSNLKISTSYQALVYITSGQAADYKEQMDLQTKLMEGAADDVVIPGINDFQGPLMHMPVTDKKEAWTNTVTAQFYGKRSVVAMDRPEWIEQYGDVIN